MATSTRTRAAKAYIPAEVRAEIMYIFSCCAACGTWDADECGHLIAEANGGLPTLENLVRLCGYCNRKQGTATVAFKAYAHQPCATMPFGEAIDLINRRRVAWAKYVSAARAKGVKNVKRYRPF